MRICKRLKIIRENQRSDRENAKEFRNIPKYPKNSKKDIEILSEHFFSELLKNFLKILVFKFYENL